MKERFDILCNNCGQTVVFRPFQEVATCAVCRTHLKLEETETTIVATIIKPDEFPSTIQTPIPTEQTGYTYPIELTEYQDQLKKLERNWEKEQENFKIKNNKKKILPRKGQSLLFTIIGAIVTLASLLFWRSDNMFLIIIGPMWLFSSGKEYYKAMQYERAKQDYDDEKERLERTIANYQNY